MVRILFFLISDYVILIVINQRLSIRPVICTVERTGCCLNTRGDRDQYIEQGFHFQYGYRCRISISISMYGEDISVRYFIS